MLGCDIAQCRKLNVHNACVIERTRSDALDLGTYNYRTQSAWPGSIQSRCRHSSVQVTKITIVHIAYTYLCLYLLRVLVRLPGYIFPATFSMHGTLSRHFGMYLSAHTIGSRSLLLQFPQQLHSTMESGDVPIYGLRS